MTTKKPNSMLSGLLKEKKFLGILLVGFALSAVAVGDPVLAMWLGFLFAGYSAIANDSIQTIGTFIASNKQRPWWQLWLFIGGVFLATMTWSWFNFGGPVDVELTGIETPESTTSDVPHVLIRMEGPNQEKLFREIKLEAREGAITDREALGIPVREGIRVTGVSVGLRSPIQDEDALVFGTPTESEKCLDSKETPPCWLWGRSANGRPGWAWDEALPEGANDAPSFDFLLGIAQTVPSGEGARQWDLVALDNSSIGSIQIDETMGGDVSNLRLLSKGFDTQVNEFHFLQLTAPLFLILLTRLRMPVSTTFLLLNIFAASGKSMGAVALKSVSGYVIAFVISIAIWGLLGKAMKRWFSGPAHPGWRIAQWCTTGCLWSVWLMQDAANIAVFLPRSLHLWEFAIFCSVILLGLGWLFWMGGEKIQEVVNEKSNVVDVRAATVLDFVYAVILYIFKFVSKIPMSTTWVFVGLLAGREIAMTFQGAGEEGRSVKDALKLAGRDLLYVTIGFVISVILAALINPAIKSALLG